MTDLDAHRPCRDSVYGLQHREKSVAESLSKLSMNDLDLAGQAEFIAAAAKQKVVVTRPLISAVLVAVLLEFLVGYNIGVMVRKAQGGGGVGGSILV